MESQQVHGFNGGQVSDHLPKFNDCPHLIAPLNILQIKGAVRVHI